MSATLLPNWQEVFDGESGQVYYWNSVTDETQWEPPLADVPVKEYEQVKERAAKIGAKVSTKLTMKQRLKKLAKLRAIRDRRRAAKATGIGGAGVGAGAGSNGRSSTADASRKGKRPKKARGVIMAETYSKTEAYVKRVYAKTETTKAMLRQVLAQSFMFETLSAADLDEVVDAMKERRVVPGEKVITQGETGDNFYVVESGDFDILIDGVGKVATRGPMDSFGEKALLYYCPRAATVQATSDGLLWAVDRVTFRHMIAHASEDNIAATVNALRSVPILSSLSDEQLSKVAAAVKLTEYHKGETIIRKGDHGDTFFMVKSGDVVCTDIVTRTGEAVSDLPLSAGDFFGERALLMSEPRAASVLATSDTVTCMELDRKPFTELLGSLHELLDAALAERVLKSIPALSSLTDSQREHAVKAFRTVSFSAGDTLATEGASEDTMIVLKEGSANVVTGGATSSTLHQHDYFGDSALLGGTAREAGLVAATDGQCFVISRTDFERVCQNATAADEAKEAAEKKAAEIVESTATKASGIRFEDLEVMRILGAGTFGRVKLTRHTPTNTPYALKILQKAQVVDFKQTTNVMNEKNVMAMIDHPFILKLAATFMDDDCLYMLLELVSGGELFSLLANTDEGFVPKEQAMFYAAAVVLGLEHLHSKNILYRDLKPENILLDDKGYAKIVDMGFAKVVPDRTYTLCGTPEYLAPELVLGKPHHKGVDYWATGILIYEMLCGYSPFADDDGDQMAIFKNIVKGKLRFPDHVGRDRALKDLVGKLLKKNVVDRYGCRKNGAQEIKDHKWFKPIDWDAIYNKTMKAPWVPRLKDPFDATHFDQFDDNNDILPYEHDPSTDVDGQPWYTGFC